MQNITLSAKMLLCLFFAILPFMANAQKIVKKQGYSRTENRLTLRMGDIHIVNVPDSAGLHDAIKNRWRKRKFY